MIRILSLIIQISRTESVQMGRQYCVSTRHTKTKRREKDTFYNNALDVGDIVEQKKKKKKFEGKYSKNLKLR